jgi:hypothetical protein
VAICLVVSVRHSVVSLYLSATLLSRCICPPLCCLIVSVRHSVVSLYLSATLLSRCICPPLCCLVVSVRHSVVSYSSRWTKFCEILHEVWRGILMSAEKKLLMLYMKTYRHFAALYPNITSITVSSNGQWRLSLLICLIQQRLKMSEKRWLTKIFGPNR